jgi:hypothetical protein
MRGREAIFPVSIFDRNNRPTPQQGKDLAPGRKSAKSLFWPVFSLIHRAINQHNSGQSARQVAGVNGVNNIDTWGRI